ncbi:MAG TPA: hypothetical protein VFG30_21185 [Polyangiales bacterium]|nr:hypothetical protein [Polyangiales bacterium]
MDRLDEPSSAFLGLLAHRAIEHPVLILVSAETDAAQRADQRPLHLFASVAEGFRLRNLDAGRNEALIVSLFGDVANVRWLADRIFNVACGNPAQVMRVAHYLVQTSACKYAAGTWTLPSSLDSEALTGALRETIDPGLPDSALELARVLTLGELTRVSIDDCLRLSSHRNLKQLQADLQALYLAGIAIVDGGEVGLSRPSWEPVLLAELAPDRRRELHLRVADFLEQRPGADFRRIQQLLRAGKVEQALDVLMTELKNKREQRMSDPTLSFEYLQGLPKDWADTYHALIDACRSLQRPLHNRLLLQIELLAYATLSARFEGACLLEVAEQLRHDTGLDLVAELTGRVPEGELLTQALGAAQRRYDSTSEHERGMPLLAAFTLLAQLTIQAIGMAGRAFDVTLLRAVPSLAPLASLSPALAVVHKNHESAVAMLTGHGESARCAYLDIARRVSEPDGAGLEGSHRFHVLAASLWAAGMMEAVLGRPSTLERAAAIEGNPLFVVSAQRLRVLYALALGDGAGAEHYRAQTELLQIQNCPPQLFEGTHAMQAAFGYEAIGDLVRVKQCLVDIEAMARSHDGWKPVVHCGRGAYQMLRGDYAQALLEFERGLTTMSVGHLGWAYCAGSVLWALVHQKDCQSAVMRGDAFFSQMQTHRREYGTFLVLVPLALAESQIGFHDGALSHIQAAIEIQSAEGGAGVRLGEAYEVRAYIALYMADLSAFREYSNACETQYRLGSQNGLLARHGKLMNAARSAGLIEALDTTDADARALSGEDAQSSVLTVLGEAHGSPERTRCALELLGRATRSSSGFLYLIRHDAAVLAAQLGSPTPWLEMDDRVARLLAEAVEEEDTTQSGDSLAEAPASSWTANDMRFTPILLSHADNDRRVVTGVALMSLDSRGARRVPTALVHALSKALFDAGDASSQSVRFDPDA